jgi:hypothetical protein
VNSLPIKASSDEAVRGAIARIELQHEMALFRKDLEIFAAKLTYRLTVIMVLGVVAAYFIVRLTERV